MFLVVGLGNPGTEYTNTRHNVGFIAADILSGRYNNVWSYKSKFDAEICVCENKFGKIIFCKPQTFMNLSGKSVQAISSFYKIPLEQIIVLHDDIDISLGKIKSKIGGGHGGHNGLKSIDSLVGQNYHRIRIGVGRPQHSRHEVSNYVLGRFSEDEMSVINLKLDKLNDAFNFLLQGEIEKFKSSI